MTLLKPLLMEIIADGPTDMASLNVNAVLSSGMLEIASVLIKRVT